MISCVCVAALDGDGALLGCATPSCLNGSTCAAVVGIVSLSREPALPTVVGDATGEAAPSEVCEVVPFFKSEPFSANEEVFKVFFTLMSVFSSLAFTRVGVLIRASSIVG